MNVYPSSFGLGLLFLCCVGEASDKQGQASKYQIEEEIIVSVPFQKSAAQTVLPVGVLSGDTLRKAVANSLGETLEGEVGVSSVSFGPGVGRIMIRGQVGNRVQVLQNSIGNVDAAAVSPDHANGVEPIFAERIEVVRGPATLLYGNGAVGGVVNVIDNRIAEAPLTATEFIVEQSHATVMDDNKTVGRFAAPLGLWNFRVDGLVRSNNNTEIPGNAVDLAALETLERLRGEEAEHEDIPQSSGFIRNSGGEARNWTLGASRAGEWGFAGFSINSIQSEYGLPPGSHAHVEDQAPAEPEQADPITRIDLNQIRLDLAGEWQLDGTWFESLRGSVSHTDYQHREIEIEGLVKTVGTEFENRGYEGRVTLDQRTVAGWSGLWGTQFSATEFSALGEEAFIPATKRRVLSLFALERWERDPISVEFGFRLERNQLDTGGRCKSHKTPLSVSVGAVYDLDESTNLFAGLSRSERAPSIEELFSNVDLDTCLGQTDPANRLLHVSTGLFEMGDPGLGNETSNNVELGVRRHLGDWEAELNVYHNQIDDFIFLALQTSAGEPDQASYLSRDAKFRGFEAQFSRAWPVSGGTLTVNAKADYVRARFSGGDNLPRIPPARIGVSLVYLAPEWSVDLGIQEVLDQNRVDRAEVSTRGHTMVSLYGDYGFMVGESELLVFARLDNLLDETVRDHTSFLNHYAPGAGRNLRVGLRFSY